MRHSLNSRGEASVVCSGLLVLMSALTWTGIPVGHARSQDPAQKPQAPAPTSFEVASIKPSEAQPGMIRMGSAPGGRYTASGVTVRMLIQQAYDLRDYQISGGPGWISSERYDIVATAGVPNVTREQMRVLLQSLLAERFNLKVRRESKELPVYALVVGKNGPKLHKTEIQPGSGGDATPPDPSKPPDAGAAPVMKPAGAGDGKPLIVSRGAGAGSAVAGGGAGVSTSIGVVTRDGVAGKPGAGWMRMGPGQVHAQGATISTLVMLLSQSLGRPVIDKTGLTGNYDFDLEFTPDETQRGMGPGGGDKGEVLPPGDPSGPSIYTAIQEQLGLKLESQKGPVEILVIESVDRPSGN